MGEGPGESALSSDVWLEKKSMPDLLLELFSEEIPARMQRQAAEDLKRLATNALVDAGLPYEGAQAFATPRRLTLHVVGLPEAQRRGPVEVLFHMAWDQASAGVTSSASPAESNEVNRFVSNRPASVNGEPARSLALQT